MAKQILPPSHLAVPTRQWFSAVLAEYALEPHHVRLLTLAAEAWDRGVMAREALAEHGMTYLDRFDQPKSRPEIAVERDSRVAFARLLRELGLDLEPSNESRPPTIQGNSSLKVAGA